MNAFVQATRQIPDSVTENGAFTFSTSLNSNLDFFFKAGASRNNLEAATKLWNLAFKENADLAIRNLLWSRDARQGAGERALFRNILKNVDDATALKIYKAVPELGRWDDLLPLVHRKGVVADTVASFIKAAISTGNGLAAKWMPRKGEDALVLRYIWGMAPKAYRKFLVAATNVVETAMCQKEWDKINFAHVPSVAAARYRKAFTRNASELYTKYMESLVKGETKINAGAVFPHDVLRSALQGGSTEAVADAQWKALPNYVSGGGILCMADVSGSMNQIVSGSINALHVSIALAMYTAERLEGPFKNMFMSFSGRPAYIFMNPNDTLSERFHRAYNSNWDMNTDLDAAFTSILHTAKTNHVPASDMPKMLLILSDMEFDHCGRLTNYQKFVKDFADAGYECPKIVFWNLNSRSETTPVRFDQRGVALISGYSPAILKSVLAAEDFSPEAIMLQTLMQDRYAVA